MGGLATRPETRGTAPIALGGAVFDLLRLVRGDLRADDDGDAAAGVLARHALVAPVTGCAVCVLEDGRRVRVAGIAGETGTLTNGSVWPLARSPVSEALGGTLALVPLDAAASDLGRAMCPAGTTTLAALPLRLGGRGAGEQTSLGALLVARETAAHFTDAECEFLEGLALLVALAVLQAGPAQDWSLRARRLRRTVDTAVDLAGTLDASEITARVLETVCDTVDASRAVLLRVTTDMLVVEGAHDVDATVPWPRGVHRLQDHPLLAEALRLQDMVLWDHGGGPAAEAAWSAPGIAHTMIVPLKAAADCTGLLVAQRRDARPFFHDDAGPVQQLATVALLALRNADLYGQARAASETMSSFLNLMVHDLRTPLAVMGGYTSLLRDGTFGEAPELWARPMEMIAAKIDETRVLVDEILPAARLDAGAVPTTIQRVDLNDVVRRAAERSQARASLVGAAVHAEVSDPPVHAAADSFHVDRIVDNLVNNAINYSGDSPWVRLSVDPSDPPAIRVEDHGAGIDSTMHERIFERFVRGDTRVPGTGFGLHIGRVLAQACGGSLTVERSAPGEGSVFRLQLRSCEPEPSGTVA